MKSQGLLGSIKNVSYSGVQKSSGWRKISIGSWRPTGDSCVNVTETIRIEPILDYIDRAQKNGSPSADINSFFSLLFGRLLADHPEFNTVVRGGQLHRRESVDTFFHIVQPNDSLDLSGMTVRSANLKTFSEISSEMSEKITQVRTGQVDEFAKSKKIFSFLPGFLAKWMLDLIGFLSYGLNLNMTWAGAPKDPFGSLMLTNVGSLGIREGYTVLAPYTRIPMVVALCAMEKTPVVDSHGKLAVGQTMKLGFTIDHRIADGIHISRMLKSLRKYVEKPESLDSLGRIEILKPSAVNRKAVNKLTSETLAKEIGEQHA